MPTINRASWWALAFAGVALAGCAGEGGESIFTGSLATAEQPPPRAEAKIDPVCVTLVARIDTLRREGIPDKIEKAAVKRYKMTQADLGKLDQLTKANADFQMRCSTVAPTTAQPGAAPPPKAPAAAKKVSLTNEP
jgi:hypothetical protein